LPDILTRLVGRLISDKPLQPLNTEFAENVTTLVGTMTDARLVQYSNALDVIVDKKVDISIDPEQQMPVELVKEDPT
jgi:hypothetical protein